MADRPRAKRTVRIRLTTPWLLLTLIVGLNPRRLRPGVDRQAPGAGSLSFGFGMLMWLVPARVARYRWGLQAGRWL